MPKNLKLSCSINPLLSQLEVRSIPFLNKLGIRAASMSSKLHGGQPQLALWRAIPYVRTLNPFSLSQSMQCSLHFFLNSRRTNESGLYSACPLSGSSHLYASQWQSH